MNLFDSFATGKVSAFPFLATQMKYLPTKTQIRQLHNKTQIKHLPVKKEQSDHNRPLSTSVQRINTTCTASRPKGASKRFKR